MNPAAASARERLESVRASLPADLVASMQTPREYERLALSHLAREAAAIPLGITARPIESESNVVVRVLEHAIQNAGHEVPSQRVKMAWETGLPDFAFLEAPPFSLVSERDRQLVALGGDGGASREQEREIPKVPEAEPQTQVVEKPDVQALFADNIQETQEFLPRMQDMAAKREWQAKSQSLLIPPDHLGKVVVESEPEVNVNVDVQKLRCGVLEKMLQRERTPKQTLGWTERKEIADMVTLAEHWGVVNVGRIYKHPVLLRMGDDPSKAQKQKADQRNGIKDKASPVAATAVQNQDVPAQRVSEGQQAEKQGDDRVAPTRPANEPHTEQAPNVVVANQSQRQPMQNKGAAEPKEKAAQQTAKGPQPEKISQEATSDAQKAQAPAPARAAPAPAPAETVPQPTASTSTAPAPASASPAPAQRPAKKAPKRDRQKANRDKTAGSQAPAPAGQQQKASSTDANSQSNVATTGANRTQQVTGLTANELLQRELMNALAAGNIALAGSITMSIVQNQMMGQTCNSSLADANQRFGGGSLGSNHVLSQGGQVPIELSQQHVLVVDRLGAIMFCHREVRFQLNSASSTLEWDVPRMLVLKALPSLILIQKRRTL